VPQTNCLGAGGFEKASLYLHSQAAYIFLVSMTVIMFLEFDPSNMLRLRVQQCSHLGYEIRKPIGLLCSVTEAVVFDYICHSFTPDLHSGKMP
jgi:hypothetical protein